MKCISLTVDQIDKMWHRITTLTNLGDRHGASAVEELLGEIGVARCYRCGDPDRPVDQDRLCSGCYRDGKNRGWTIYPVEES